MEGLRNLVARSNEEEGCLSYVLHTVSRKPDELVILLNQPNAAKPN